MGQDSGVKSRHRRRTPPHQKHTVFPGMKTPKGVTITAGSIKGKSSNINVPVVKSTSYTNPLWSAYDNTAKKLGSYGSSVPLQIRRLAEYEYSRAYEVLQKSGLITKIKDKYTKR